jgi:hypothetical protein
VVEPGRGILLDHHRAGAAPRQLPTVADLIAAICRVSDAWNDRCAPFTWTKDPDTVIAKATHPPQRKTQTASDTEHWGGGSAPCDAAETASGGPVSRSVSSPSHDDGLSVSTPATRRRPVTPHGRTFVTMAMRSFVGPNQAWFLTRYRLRVQCGG